MERKAFWWFDSQTGQILETNQELRLVSESYDEDHMKKEETELEQYSEFPTGDQYLPQGKEDFSL